MTVRLRKASREERRGHSRYPLNLKVHYTIRSRHVPDISGEGTTVNISSTGMLLRCAQRLGGGEKLIAAVEWPSTAEGTPVLLLFHGQVVWTKGTQVGVAVSHYGFVPNSIPEDGAIENLPASAPRHLTPTKPYPSTFLNVRQWRRSVY